MSNNFDTKSPISKEKTNNKSSFSLLAKMAMNTSNMLGPAIICLPFVMQKSGLIPTIITLLFLCLFSTFSSLCLTETVRLINGIKSTNIRKFDYNNLIDTLIKDSILAYSSKCCIIISHLLYTILCIITLCKTATIFLIERFETFSFITKLAVTDEDQTQHYGNFIFSFGNSIINSEEMVILLTLFLVFLILYLLFSLNLFKRLFNFVILGLTLTVISLIVFYVAHLNNYTGNNSVSPNKLVSLIGGDFTYLYGTILFSFSFVSAIPSWSSEEEVLSPNSSYTQRKALHYSAFVGITFKLIFSIGFSYLITFGSDFSMKDYVLTHKKHEDSFIYSNLIIALTVFLIFTLYNGIINHTQLLFNAIKNQTEFSLSWVISVFSPWILSLLLIVNGMIFLNILNWSSIFIFGYVNYILPLLLYVQAVNEAETFESNYKQSALIDFENFIYLKKEEICENEEEKTNQDSDQDTPLIPDSKQNTILMFNINNVISELQQRLTKHDEIDEETKEKVVDLFFEIEGYYSIAKSYSLMFGGLIKTKTKVSILFFATIIFLLTFMIFSIYFALYNFFINKTLVVNIFLQIK